MATTPSIRETPCVRKANGAFGEVLSHENPGTQSSCRKRCMTTGPSYSSSQTRTLAVREVPSGPAYFRVSELRRLEQTLSPCWYCCTPARTGCYIAAANSLSTSSSSSAKSSIIFDHSKPSILNAACVVMRCSLRWLALGTTRFSEPRGPGSSALVALGTPTAQGPRLTKSRSSRGSASNLYTCPIKW